MMIIRC